MNKSSKTKSQKPKRHTPLQRFLVLHSNKLTEAVKQLLNSRNTKEREYALGQIDALRGTIFDMEFLGNQRLEKIAEITIRKVRIR